jgi:uncharacterized protein
VKDTLKFLIELQEKDSGILEKRAFIDRVPSRIFEKDDPLKHATAELESIKHKNEALLKKKREKEAGLNDINEKINKMKSRASELKTNKEYQAHLKEIETFEKEISAVEESILIIMEELDNSLKQQEEKAKKAAAETEKINAFKKELSREVEKNEKELSLLKEERSKLAAALDPDIYNTYMSLLRAGSGVAVTRAQNEICLGCNMNIPPQLFVELKKNEEIIQCQQCRRILYFSEAE